MHIASTRVSWWTIDVHVSHGKCGQVSGATCLPKSIDNGCSNIELSDNDFVISDETCTCSSVNVYYTVTLVSTGLSE